MWINEKMCSEEIFSLWNVYVYLMPSISTTSNTNAYLIARNWASVQKELRQGAKLLEHQRKKFTNNYRANVEENLKNSAQNQTRIFLFIFNKIKEISGKRAWAKKKMKKCGCGSGINVNMLHRSRSSSIKTSRSSIDDGYENERSYNSTYQKSPVIMMMTT